MDDYPDASSQIGVYSFEWPIDHPDRAPYRGRSAFEPVDAGIFFGRDAQIVRAMDVLRRMREERTKQWFVILGPSGSGKSSFLRAGLLPRMQRDDREFLVLSVVRPDQDVLLGANGFAQAIYSARTANGLNEPPLEDIGTVCLVDPAEVRRLVVELQNVVQSTIVLPLDEAEELLSPSGTQHATEFLILVRELDVIVAATIRSDRFGGLQTRPELADVAIELFGELRPMPTEQFKEIITSPAERVTAGGRPLRFAPDLVDQLLADFREGGDPLPLLSLTLSELYGKYGNSTELTLRHYEQLGGPRRVVQTVIDDILDPDPTTRLQQLDLLRSAFIPALAGINPETDQPTRRLARWSEIPRDSRPLVDAFVANRLLIRDRRDGDDVVEVALESLLWQWDDLATWLNDSWHELKAIDDLERAAAAWEHNNRHEDWLLDGNRLARAEILSSRPEFRERVVNTIDYLGACQHSIHDRERQEMWEATARQLVGEAHEILEGKRLGGDVRAFQLTLAARLLTREPDDGIIYSTAMKRRTTHKLIELTSGTLKVAYGQDGNTLAVASYREGPFWSADTGQPFGGMDDKLSDISLSSDGRHLVTKSWCEERQENGNLLVSDAFRIWDVQKREPIGDVLQIHEGLVDAVALSLDGFRLAAAGWRHAALWNTRTHEQVADLQTGHTKKVQSLSFSPDGSRLASGGADNTVRLWDARTGKSLCDALAGHSDVVNDLAFSPDGRLLASAGDDRTVRLWDGDTGQQVAVCEHLTPVKDVAFSSDGLRLASGTAQEVRLWDGKTGAPIGEPLTGQEFGAFRPDGECLATRGEDSTVRLWATRTGRPVGQPLTGRPSSSVAFSPDGQCLASAESDRTVRVLDTHDRFPIIAWGQHCVAFNPDGKTIATTDSRGCVVLYDPYTGRESGPRIYGHDYRRTARRNMSTVRGVAFSPNGKILASASTDGTSKLWDVESGLLVKEISTGYSDSLGVWCVAFSPDGSRLATAGGGDVRLWDTQTGQSLGSPLIGHTNAVFGVAFSPDGTRLASASRDGTVRLWDGETGLSLNEPLAGHGGGVMCVAFSPDGRLLASGGHDTTVRLWDAGTGQPVGRPLTGHWGGVQGVAFSPDGHRVASASLDQTVRMWSVHNGQRFGDVLTGHDAPVYGLAFSPDGYLIASVDNDTLRVLPATATPEDLCAKLTANMSRKRWREWVSPHIPYMETCPGLPIPPDEDD